MKYAIKESVWCEYKACKESVCSICLIVIPSMALGLMFIAVRCMSISSGYLALSVSNISRA